MPLLNENRVHGIVFVSVCLSFLLVAQKGLQGPFVLDSPKLYSLDAVVEEHGGAAVLHTPGFGTDHDRILSMATFVLDAQARDGILPMQVKTTNLIIHIVTAALIYFLARVLVHATPCREAAGAIALATSLMWLLSPLNLNVALYAIQRMAMLAALFTVAGLLLYALGRLRDPGWRRRLCLAGALACVPLAYFSKQNGILIVPLAFLVEIWLLHPARPWFPMRRIAGALLACLVAGALLATMTLAPGVFDYENRAFTLAERLLTQPRALVSYMANILAPAGADTGIYTDGYAASRGLFSPPTTLFAALACLAAAVFCIWFRRGRLQFAAFGVGFFLIGHLLESTILPLELYFAHRNYLPGFGLYFALSSLLVSFVPRRSWQYVLLGAYCAWFAIIGYTRADTWSSREKIVIAAVGHNPDSGRAWSNLSQLAVDAGQFELAGRAVDRTVELSGTPNAYVQRLFVLCRAGSEITSSHYRQLTAIRRFGVANEVSQALSNLLTLFEQGGCAQLEVRTLVDNLDELAGQYRRAGEDSWVIEYYADSFLYASGQRQHAHRRLQERLEKGHLESGMYRLELLLDEGELDEAGTVLETIDEGFSEAQRAQYEETLREFDQRITGSPSP